MCIIAPACAGGVKSGHDAVYGNSATGPSSQVVIDANQVGGAGNKMTLNVYNVLGQGIIPEATFPPTPAREMTPKDSIDCHLAHGEFKSAVDAFFHYTLTAKENRYLTLASGANIYTYDRFLSQTDGVYLGSFDFQNQNHRTDFIAKVRAISDVAMLEVRTIQYGWVVVIYALNDNGRIIECRAIDTNPENGRIRVENPEGWLRVDGRGGTINIPDPSDRYPATDIRQIK